MVFNLVTCLDVYINYFCILLMNLFLAFPIYFPLGHRIFTW